MARKTFTSREPFSIPFTVTTGKVTYLGKYQANGLTGKNFVGLPLAAGAVFVVQDRQAKDMDLLRKRRLDLPLEVINAVPNIQNIGSPLFVTSKPMN